VAEPFPLGRTARLAVFASGRGSNLAALLEAFPPAAAAGGDAAVALVVSDRAAAGALDLARRAGVPALHVPFRPDRAAFERSALDALEAARVDLVLLAGFMRILSPAFVDRWPGRLLNVHPSLLPDFPGLHAARQALDAGATRTGCTVHFVDAGVDTGPVVARHEVPILPGDDEAGLQARIQAAEHRLYPAAVRHVLRGEVGARPIGATS
jgi:phosphoribosylglycinamide formyltransferase 1